MAVHLPSVYASSLVTDEIVALALRDVFTVWSALDHSDGVATRKALESVYSEIINTYGTAVAATTADRFEELRDISEVTGRYTAILTDDLQTELIEAKLRAELEPLFRGENADPLIALDNLNRLTDRMIKGQGRKTMELNTRRDKKALGYARVPTGDWTCGFCLMLASRGPIYESQSTATYKAMGGKYHDLCNCQATPVFTHDTVIEGYDEGALYDYYTEARKRAQSGNHNDITKALEEMAAEGLYDISAM